MDFVCNKHRDRGVQSVTWSHLKTYSKGCRYCSGRGKTIEEVAAEVKDKNVELVSAYLGNEKPIRCRCKVCGNEWTTLPKVLVTNGSGCPLCGIIKRANAKRKKHELFVADLKSVNPDIEVIGEYVGAHRIIKCKCLKDGMEWDGIPANLLNRSAGCPACSMSLGEKELLTTLTALGISFSAQYSISCDGYKRALRFDAFNQEHNIAFEYNGEQHFFPVGFGASEKTAQYNFERCQKRDNDKRKYCDEHGIVLVEIPYWEKNNIKQFVVDELEKKGLKSIIKDSVPCEHT